MPKTCPLQAAGEMIKGMLQAYAGVRRRPVIDSSKIPKVPMWPPDGVFSIYYRHKKNKNEEDQNNVLRLVDPPPEIADDAWRLVDPQYIRRDVWVRWDWSRFFEWAGDATFEPGAAYDTRHREIWHRSFTMDVPESDFSKLNQTALMHVRRKEFFKKVDLDDPKDVFSKTLYLMEYEFISDYKTRDYIEFPFNFEDFAKLKSHLAALTLKPKTDSDLPKNLCECMEGFTSQIRFRYFKRHCPYITTKDWDDLSVSALEADYELQIGRMYFKREEVKEWLNVNPAILTLMAGDAEANIKAWTETEPN